MKKHSKSILIVLLLGVIALLIGIVFCLLSQKPKPIEAVEEIQTEYVAPETPVDRSKVVSLNGWSTMNVQANTTDLTTGANFKNPQSNLFYEDVVYVDGKKVETLVVDSGEKVELNHYLKIAGINSEITEVGNFDKNALNISNDAGIYTIEAVAPFENDQMFDVTTSDGKKHTFTVKCHQDYYYLKYKFYLGNSGDMDNAELLYESELIEPGKTVQQIEITRKLDKGTYDAFVLIQPYASDKQTELNNGIVNFTLNAE